jgi:hypothetical protein
MRCAIAAMILALSSSVALAKEPPRPLSMEAVDAVIEQHDRAVQRCGHGAGHGEARAIFVQLHIDGAGAVVEARPRGKSSAEAACISNVVRKMKFPAAGTSSRLDFPFMLIR